MFTHLPMGIKGSCLLFRISLSVELSTGSSSGVHVGLLVDAFTLFEAISIYLWLGRFPFTPGLRPSHLLSMKYCVIFEVVAAVATIMLASNWLKQSIAGPLTFVCLFVCNLF